MVFFILTLMPLLSTFSFHSFSLLITSSSVSAITAKSSAYSENRLYTREFKLQITKSDRQHSWHQCQVTVYIHKYKRIQIANHKIRPTTQLAPVPSYGLHSQTTRAVSVRSLGCKKGKGSPYAITERRVQQLIPVLGSQPAGEVSHKPGGRPLLSARPAVTPATLKRAATNFAAW